MYVTGPADGEGKGGGVQSPATFLKIIKSY